MIDEEVQKILAPEITASEQLLWADRPRRAPVWIILGSIGFGLFFFGVLGYPLLLSYLTDSREIFETMNFTINGKKINSETPASVIFEGLIIIFLTFSFYVAFFIIYLCSRTREIYGLTDFRVFVVKPFPFRRVISLNLRSIVELRKTGGGKVGSLEVGTNDPSIFRTLLRLYRIHHLSFLNVRHPKRIEELIFENLQPRRESKSQ